MQLLDISTRWRTGSTTIWGKCSPTQALLKSLRVECSPPLPQISGKSCQSALPQTLELTQKWPWSFAYAHGETEVTDKKWACLGKGCRLDEGCWKGDGCHTELPSAVSLVTVGWWQLRPCHREMANSTRKPVTSELSPICSFVELK